MSDSFPLLASEIHACTRCPRLAAYLAESREKHPDYWSKPVSGYGDPEARLYMLGLAPGFHGANQHGHLFTGDDAGRWVWGGLYEVGASDVVNSTRGDQPAHLTGVWIGAAARCVPPQNRPLLEELNNCRDFVRRELELLPNVRVVLALGKIAHDAYLKIQGEKLSHYPFAHGRVHRTQPDHPILINSFHTSRQNTNTGVLTREMWLELLKMALALANRPEAGTEYGGIR